MANDPSVSVVVPCRDAERWLALQLEALVAQEYDGFLEIIVADNGSTDASREIVGEFPGVVLVEASGMAAPNVARSAGAKAAKGDLILFADADDVVAPGWVVAMVGALGEYDVVTGVMEMDLLNDSIARFRQRKPGPRFGFLPAAHGGNLGIRRGVLDALGGWDETHPYGPDDIEMAWKAQLAGYSLGRADTAIIHYRLRTTSREQRGQALVHGRNLPRLIRQFRSQGLSYWGFVVRALQFVGFMAWSLPVLPFSRSLRTEWMRRAYVAVGFARGLLGGDRAG